MWRKDEKWVDIIYQRNFDTLLFDSIDMLLLSINKNIDGDFEQALARSSMLNSILILESCSNICIESLELERSVFKEIDRLAFLAKFDFYLRTSFCNKRIEKGISEVEGVQELKRLRDAYVHMKSHKIEIDMVGDSGSGDYEKTKLLGIPKNPAAWDWNTALKGMKTVHLFLKYFFKDTCEYSPIKVNSFLMAEEKIPGKGGCIIPVSYSPSIEAISELGVDLSYIELI
jgi:hypothetical protein